MRHHDGAMNEPTFTDALDRLEREILMRLGERRRFGPGATIFAEGQSSTAAFVVLDGRVRISFRDEDGAEVVLAERADGDVLAELSAVDGAPHSVTCSALEETELLEVPAELFRGFVGSHPHAALHILAMLGRNLRGANRRRAEFGP